MAASLRIVIPQHLQRVLRVLIPILWCQVRVYIKITFVVFSFNFSVTTAFDPGFNIYRFLDSLKLTVDFPNRLTDDLQ